MQKDKIVTKIPKELKLSSKIHFGRLGNKCAYCGAYADTKDHILPASFFAGGRKGTLRQHSANENIVRCCKECNNLCSNTIFDNFWKKKKYLADIIEWRYRNIIYSPKWTDEEIDELEGSLKRVIQNYQLVKEFVKIRLENLNTPEVYE